MLHLGYRETLDGCINESSAFKDVRDPFEQREISFEGHDLALNIST